MLTVHEAEVSKPLVVVRGDRDCAPNRSARNADPYVNALCEQRVGAAAFAVLLGAGYILIT